MPQHQASPTSPLQRTPLRLVGMSMTAAFLLTFTLVFPPKLFAQGPGQPCSCPGGYSYSSVVNTCISDSLVSGCSGIATGVCGIPGIPPLCESIIVSECVAVGVAGGLTVANLDAVCAGFLGALGLPVSWVPTCVAAVTPFVGLISTTTKAPTCDAGLLCNIAGACEPRPSGVVFTPDECELDIPGAPPSEPGIPGIMTALGCIPDDPIEFVAWIQRSLLGIGGGIALLLMGVGAGYILVSRGNPEQIKHGKEVFTGAAIGLALMIFAVFLLQLIGVDILGVFRR